MTVALVLAVTVGLVAATVLVHYEVLRLASTFVDRAPLPPRTRILLVIGAVMAAHVAEICLYAFAFWALHVADIGQIAGEFKGDAVDFFYFSATSFTTLGVGDLFPHGLMRLLVGVEAVNGFVLIGWSASFTYLAMGKLWEAHRPRR